MNLTPDAAEQLCHAQSAAAGEDLAGSAPTALGWLLVEQPGPWGRKAATESRLDPELGAALETAAAEHGVRLALVRRPRRHPDDHAPHPRTVFAASSLPDRTGLWTTTVEDPAALLDLDFAALAAGRGPAAWDQHPRPLLLVCTNGRRDRCCALLGRPVAESLHADYGDQVWETTHLSGHRFAATTAVLPWGYLHGRLTLDDAADVLRSANAGRLALSGLRGRATWSAHGQAAEIAVREHLEERDPAALEVQGDRDRVLVRHRDGRGWSVDVVESETAAARAESCGKAAIPVRTLRASSLASTR